MGLLLAACGSDFEPPIARTNPNPTERYEISVELVDPPADIVSISGLATFGIADPMCMPTPDRIAGYAPDARFDRTFSLSRTARNVYKGYLFLDWPLEEDYYGLGVCKWQLRSARAIINFGKYKQEPRLWGDGDFPSAGREWRCRRPDSKRILENCTTSEDTERLSQEVHDSWLVILSSTRN